MSNVYIDSLTLENFGPFYGEHKLDFRSLEGKCGILVGGKNGAGKTHILRALYLAVVGESGVGDLRRVETGSDATKFLFERALNRRALKEGEDTCRFKAVITLRDEHLGNKKIELQRSVRFRPNSSPVWEHLAVRSDTNGVIDDEQVIQKLRDSFLPRHLARFFFFDAERSQSINLGHQEIVEGISRILGLWTYSELESDLRQLISSKIPRIFNIYDGQNPQTLLAEYNGKIITVEGILKAKRKELDGITRSLHEIESELTEVEDDLKSLGAVDPEELEKIQERHAELTKTKNILEVKLSQAWEAALPISLLGSYRKDLFDSLRKEEIRREWENAKSTVEPKIPQVKSDVFNNVPEDYILNSKTVSFYTERLELALHKLFNPPPEGMADNIFIIESNELSSVVRSQLCKRQSEVSDLSEICSNIERMDAELRELNQKLKNIQQNSIVFKRGAELHEKRGKLLGDIEKTKKQINEIEADIVIKETELVELKRQEAIQQEIVNKIEKGESLAALATRYREAAGEIRTNAAIQMRKEISDEVGKLWVEIAEREKEFYGMEFDTNWQCWLIKRDGTRVTWEETNTSAGQRQVRMLSFYEALRRLAKTVPPLVVDTPLARLDKEIRSNVLDRLYLMGHQSIILSTNAEIDPEGKVFKQIQQRLARAYTLNPIGNPNSNDYEVKISNDYFGHELEG